MYNGIFVCESLGVNRTLNNFYLVVIGTSCYWFAIVFSIFIGDGEIDVTSVVVVSLHSWND